MISLWPYTSGSSGPGERLPPQSELMTSYGAAMGTAPAALGKLVAAGLIRTVAGAGTLAARRTSSSRTPCRPADASG
ncbi:GntR family transcriptional regulator [Streptomyces sp. NPDC101166]|uniref:GntR family transcriptional regulator n=1 Tax=Streptomyces sp. NPDC101166 TaxID=3366120 RepID=UPI00381CE297